MQGLDLTLSASIAFKRITIRAVVVPLRRPVIADIGRFDRWPFVLLDLETTAGVIGRSYIAPYRASTMPAIAAELRDLVAVLEQKELAPFDVFSGVTKGLRCDWRIL